MNQQSIEHQKMFYNEYWQEFEYANYLKLARCAAILDRLQQTKLVQPKIIDLGCGTGWLTGILGHFGPAVGVDLSDIAIRQAQKRYPFVEFIQANIIEWDYPRSSFDLVISQEVIEHFENQASYIEVAYGLLKGGGYLILTTPNKNTFYAMPEEQRKAWAVQPIENWLTAPELKAVLRSCGFEVIQMTTVIPAYGIKGIYRLFASRRLRQLLKFLYLEGLFLRLRLRLGLGLHLFTVARKPL
ncbi:MAG TPA: class I SAM-dependent methyltransferase [Anaerolineales bacterium]|nr:class I SAM-dependent methyltransferase [Anaerolineales bacterium]